MAAFIFLAGPSAVHGEMPISPVGLEQFQFGGIGVFQQFSGNVFSAHVAWTPGVMLGESCGLRGEFGVAPLKNYFGRFFFATNYEIFLYQNVISSLNLEVGGGISTWIGNGGTAPIASGNLVLVFEETAEKIFVGYSRFFLKDYPTHEVKVGFGIDFSYRE